MPRKMTFNGEKYDYLTVSVVTGEKEPEKLSKWQETLAYVLENPDELPFLLDTILKFKKTDELRKSLVRVQMFADLHMSENMEMYQMWKYTSETIETLIYGSLALDKGFTEKKKTKKKSEKKVKE